MNDRRRLLPPIHSLLGLPALEAAARDRGRTTVLQAVRRVLEEARSDLAEGRPLAPDPDDLVRRALAILTADRPRLRPVLNATGILIHTGLGRAPLAAEAVGAVERVVRGYCNLEIDLETGGRGRRAEGVAELLRRLTGAEAAEVVNNNAAATVLTLRALAAGREVITSRGQLVEIGGGFRLPEIFEVSGARLREVGTTNKTRLSDYERAIGPETAALLRVHASNFRIVGFTESVPIADLASLGKSRGLWTIDDIGSGALDAGLPPGVTGEPTVAEGLAAGADLVLFSGDKLLGGPQSGLIVGSKAAVSRVSSDPLMRALRVDKMTLAALEATLYLALDPALGGQRISLWSFLSTTVEVLRHRAERLAESFRSELGLNAAAIESTAYLGGGSVPVDPLPSAAVRVAAPFPDSVGSEAGMAQALRIGNPAVMARVQGGAVLFDLRALPEGDDSWLVEATRGAIAGRGTISEQ